MRPVERGPIPVDKEGNLIVYKDYRNAKRALIERLGKTCSYCEQKTSALEVEHIVPKSARPELALCWDNFLLACRNCNAVKSDRSVDDVLLPDRDNTFLALKYKEGGIVEPNKSTPIEIQRKAQNLIALVGLDRTPQQERATDRRWLDRREARELATRAKDRLTQNDSVEMREQIVDQALEFFSIWTTVFADDPDMRRRFIEKFEGTAKDCFDSNAAPCKRPNGQI